MTGESVVDVEGLATEVMSRLEAAANPKRAAKGASYTPTGARIIGVTVPDMRRVARDAARELKDAPPRAVLALARALIDTHTLEGRQAAYEVLSRHKGVRAALDASAVESLGRGMDNWASVDAFCWLVSGPAWLEGRIGDGVIDEWARSAGPVVAQSRTRLHDGPEQEVTGRQRRYPAHAERYAGCWLRTTTTWSSRPCRGRCGSSCHGTEPAVAGFLEEHDGVLAARVKREVRNKLETGLKNPGRR